MTSTDLKAYLGIIARMKGLLNSPEFEQTFASLTASLPKSKQFLLKMELKRLAQPCNYFIDLRGHVDGDVKPYQYMEKTHYLDSTAQQIFEEGIRDYGEYTLGVYEDAMNAENSFDLTLITKSHLFSQEVANQLKQMKRQDAAKPIELYITVSKDEQAKLTVNSHYDFEFSSAEELKAFIHEAIAHHTLFSFRLFVSRTGKLDSEYIAKEIGYISVYAIHKAKSLEEELWHVEGVADGVETSAEVIARFNVQASERQHQARLAILSSA
ncbi:hypothetical protein [Alishewanella longhuensis]